MPGRLSREDKDEAKQVFELADKEGRGHVSSKQVGTMLRALGYNPSDEELESILSGRGDTVTMDEFVDMLGAGQLKETDNEEDLRIAFMFFDREGQGWISGAELRFMLANMGEKMSYDEVDMLLEEAGVDNDGKFRYNEFIDQLNRD